MAPNTPQQRSQPRYQPRRPVVASTAVPEPGHDALAAQPAVAPAVATPEVQTPVPVHLVLPLAVVSRADISRSLREVEKLDDYFNQARIRGSNVRDLPKLGHVLDALATENRLNLLNGEHRAALREFLSKLKAQAPVVHMSFPSEAGSDFTGRLLSWFRTEAHPYTVLHIGLQPELAAGCIMRTSNKFFDFSFRARFEKSKEKLIAALEATDKAIQAAASAPAAQPTSPPVEGGSA